MFAIPFAWAGPASHPAIAGTPLTVTIAAQDSALFNAYNHCDLVTFARYIAPDIEFYHDKGGLTLGRANMVESIRHAICGKLRRELMPGTLEVYPIKDYGAVEIGEHRFCELSTGRCDAVGRFIHLWRYRNGSWQLSRVISYDHHKETASPG
ncbi:nuclear transport factor 2 family protein [Dyella jejuensis]|uniref:Nuclear transport factor 2 family protein n=2 Tax=Dyella jejuensis TaxID=1432009 RepID=A0ABW8JKM3_9GAMM